ncbi:MAG: hypothetical protein K0B81_09215 [Candidatus Cloacimonetes bacterium]|nr:hypothetical protein [Candidatus Cloacimonadota bacterium]
MIARHFSVWDKDDLNPPAAQMERSSIPAGGEASPLGESASIYARMNTDAPAEVKQEGNELLVM